MTMQPLTCDECGIGVLVEKFSPAHTSIQWESDTSWCPAMKHELSLGDHRRECAALRRTIDDAIARHEVAESRIELPTGSDLPRLH